MLLAGLLTGCGADHFAKVLVETNPPTAEVWIGNKLTDSSPCELLFDSDGDYEVYVKKAGYETVLKRVKVIEKEIGDRTVIEAHPERMMVTLDALEDAGDDNYADDAPAPYYDE
jgi:hypothetical protein